VRSESNPSDFRRLFQQPGLVHEFPGAGMDEIITTICRIFLGSGDKALIPVPTYNFYGLAVELCGAVPHYQPRLAGFSVDQKIPEGIKMTFLCSPNNPTGNALSEENVRAVVEGTESIVFLDEAYAEFAGKSLLKLVREYDNLVVGRTLSKAFGLAGLRLSYAVAPPWIARQYRRVAPLFGISSLSLAAGVAALQDLGWMRKYVGKIVAERERMHAHLGYTLGVTIFTTKLLAAYTGSKCCTPGRETPI
jgi:histidinol-phosphate aminotransferase